MHTITDWSTTSEITSHSLQSHKLYSSIYSLCIIIIIIYLLIIYSLYIPFKQCNALQSAFHRTDKINHLKTNKKLEEKIMKYILKINLKI